MMGKEWGGMGQNYLRSLLALGFQAFLIIVCGEQCHTPPYRAFPAALIRHKSYWSGRDAAWENRGKNCAAGKDKEKAVPRR